MSEHFLPNPPVRRMSARASADLLNRVHADSSAEQVIADALSIHDRGDVALVSSFGADAAVLLHMVSRIDRNLPVLLIETGMLFPETLEYQQELTRKLDLGDVRLIRPEPEDLARDDPDDTLHLRNTDGCCHIRKVLPLERALAPFSAWISGRKRFQASSRSRLQLFEAEEGTARLKINPLAFWKAEDVRSYMDRHDLPRHPLVSRGYLSIGCAPCTTPVGQGEDARAGRWRGEDKVECGIHFDGEKWVRVANSLPGGF